MIKIMIVDDMPAFRDYLRDSIDWASYGFEVCCEATNGKEAIALFMKHYPDVVLTDITMPYMDGLILSERLLEECPEVAIVAITGNSEFEYAKKAIKLGLRDYIVKPFEKEELILTLLKLQDNINKSLEGQGQQKIKLSDEIEVQFRQLIYAGVKPELLPSSEGYFLVATVKVNKYENLRRTEAISNWEIILMEMLQSMLEEDGKSYVFSDFEGNIVTVIQFATEEEQQQFRGYAFKDLVRLMRDYLKIESVVGISNICCSYQGIQEAYNQSIQAINSLPPTMSQCIMHYSKVNTVGRPYFFSADLIQKINMGLELLAFDKVEAAIREGLQTDEDNPYNMVMYMSLMSIPFSYSVKVGRDITSLFGKDFRPYDELEKCKNQQAQIAFVLMCYKKVIDCQLDHQETKSVQIAEGVRAYIDEHYAETDLSIDTLSRHLLVNQTYLRQMFKSEMHMTIGDYLTKVRMETSKQLIEQGTYKLGSIGEMVGYKEGSYFSKCFKKYFGIAPSFIKIDK